MRELLLKKGEETGMEMRGSVSQRNHKGRNRKCAFATTKGPRRWKRKINNESKVPYLLGKWMDGPKKKKNRHFIQCFKILRRFYLCRIYGKEFCSLHHWWVEANARADCTERMTWKVKGGKKNSSAKALNHYSSPGSRENIHICVETSVQGRKEPCGIAPHYTLLSESDLSQPFSPSASFKPQL